MTDILEEAAFRLYRMSFNPSCDTEEVRRAFVRHGSVSGNPTYANAARAVLEFAAEVVTGEQPVSLGSDDDAQRAICRRIAAKLTGGSHV